MTFKKVINYLMCEAIKAYDRAAVEHRGFNPDEVICVRGTQRWGDQSSVFEYRGRLVVTGDNGNRRIVMLDRQAPVDSVGEWVDLKLLPEQAGVKITRADGRQETYTSADKHFIETLVTSWGHTRGIEG